MLACYYSQGKQLASGVIDRSTNQSHYNVSVIHTTPCATLFLCHLWDQRILTRTCARPVSLLSFQILPLLHTSSNQLIPLTWYSPPISSPAAHLLISPSVFIPVPILALIPCQIGLCLLLSCILLPCFA